MRQKISHKFNKIPLKFIVLQTVSQEKNIFTLKAVAGLRTCSALCAAANPPSRYFQRGFVCLLQM